MSGVERGTSAEKRVAGSGNRPSQGSASAGRQPHPCGVSTVLGTGKCEQCHSGTRAAESTARLSPCAALIAATLGIGAARGNTAQRSCDLCRAKQCAAPAGRRATEQPAQGIAVDIGSRRVRLALLRRRTGLIAGAGAALLCHHRAGAGNQHEQDRQAEPARNPGARVVFHGRVSRPLRNRMSFAGGRVRPHSSR